MPQPSSEEARAFGLLPTRTVRSLRGRTYCFTRSAGLRGSLARSSPWLGDVWGVTWGFEVLLWVYCLRVTEAVRDAEEFEGSPLQRGEGGEFDEWRHVVGGLDVVDADGGQILEQGGEAMHRVVVFGAFAGGFGEGGIGALGRGDGVGALGRSAGFVVVMKQQRGQGLFHVPADVVGQHPQKHVGAYPIF